MALKDIFNRHKQPAPSGSSEATHDVDESARPTAAGEALAIPPESTEPTGEAVTPAGAMMAAGSDAETDEEALQDSDAEPGKIDGEPAPWNE